jgi:lipoprotein signal peptidase
VHDDPSVSETARPEAADDSATHDVWSHLRLWPVAALGLAADLWSKQWAFTHLPSDPMGARELIPRLLSFRRTLNEGALFGLGKGLWLVFIIASVLALAFVWYLFAQSTRDRRSLHVALALILAGAMGNLYDRAWVLADVVRTNRGSFTGIVLRETKDYVELGTYPDGKPLQRFDKRRDGVTIKHQGVVRDFIKIEPKFGIELWPWVFNVADVLLVAGVALLLLNFWRERREARSHGSGTSSENSPLAGSP